MKWIPHGYQKRTARFIVEKPKAAVWLDMGLGKTVSTLTAISVLQDRLESRAALVVAPLRVCQLTWPDEVAKWDHLKHLRVSSIIGEAKEREAACRAQADIYLINYENLIWLYSKMAAKMKSAPWDMLVLDEASKMKNPTSRRFKILKPHLSTFSRVVELTGTPAPQSYEDLWSQVFLLDRGERLGTYITHYRDQYFRSVDPNGYKLVMVQGAKEKIERKIQDLVLCMKAEDYLEMPKLIENIVEVPLPEEARKQYKKLEEEMYLVLDASEGKAVEALNAASLSSKLRQMTSGAIYDPQKLNEDGNPVGERTWHDVHSAKLEAVDDIIEEANGQPVMVVYEFQSELARLLAKYPKAPWIGGGSKGNVKTIETAWTRGEIPILLVHPASVGHGLNLQYGGHIQVWTSGTWSLELDDQTVARLYRQGQTKPVIVHRLVCPKTVDEVVVKAIREKTTGQANLVAALKAARPS